ncbi:MAG: hypothetical protein JNL32_02185 [Candidatus Kapabacteria bacterium]|nr:hypothetical protein [Candidatus Kapabacteria bacterium]
MIVRNLSEYKSLLRYSAIALCLFVELSRCYSDSVESRQKEPGTHMLFGMYKSSPSEDHCGILMYEHRDKQRVKEKYYNKTNVFLIVEILKYDRTSSCYEFLVVKDLMCRVRDSTIIKYYSGGSRFLNGLESFNNNPLFSDRPESGTKPTRYVWHIELDTSLQKKRKLTIDEKECLKRQVRFESLYFYRIYTITLSEDDKNRLKKSIPSFNADSAKSVVGFNPFYVECYPRYSFFLTNQKPWISSPDSGLLVRFVILDLFEKYLKEYEL